MGRVLRSLRFPWGESTKIRKRSRDVGCVKDTGNLDVHGRFVPRKSQELAHITPTERIRIALARCEIRADIASMCACSKAPFGIRLSILKSRVCWIVSLAVKNSIPGNRSPGIDQIVCASSFLISRRHCSARASTSESAPKRTESERRERSRAIRASRARLYSSVVMTDIVG